jgi:hypothetical protein
MVFIETSLFTRLLPRYLNDDEYLALQWYLFQHPDVGDIVPSSGGVRKVRWSSSGKGKRGRIRVIYYWKVAVDELWLLTVYAKSERSTIAGHLLKHITQEIEDE